MVSVLHQGYIFIFLYTHTNVGIPKKWNWNKISERNIIKCKTIANSNISIKNNRLRSMAIKLHEICVNLPKPTFGSIGTYLQHNKALQNHVYVLWDTEFCYSYQTWYSDISLHMMTSSNENIFRVTGDLCVEFTCHRWIPRSKASDAELWCFFYLRLIKRLSKQSRGWWFGKPSRPLWRHCNEAKPLPLHTGGRMPKSIILFKSDCLLRPVLLTWNDFNPSTPSKVWNEISSIPLLGRMGAMIIWLRKEYAQKFHCQ